MSTVRSNTRIEEEVKKNTVFDLPENLNTPRFQQVWSDFETHRKEKKSPLTPTARRLQLKKLAFWGEDRAFLAVERAVTSGYTGIFEDKKRGDAVVPPQPTLKRVDLVNA